jgi:hypothetical protein
VSSSVYLVFGDLHGSILPAFKLAQAWSREHGVALAGLLQVGDLCDFPFNRTARRSFKQDRSERGERTVALDAEEANEVFGAAAHSEALWFTAGNHEDYGLLKERERTVGRTAESFGVDAHGKVQCIRDGCVAELPGGLHVGALWGVDDCAPHARERIPAGGRIRRRSVAALSGARFDVLLMHESPRDAVLADHGSEAIGAVIRSAQPAFAFFGHYHRIGRRIEGDFGATRVYHLSHLELDSRAEEASVGVLTWSDDGGEFAYLDPAWLRTVTRHNWRRR